MPVVHVRAHTLQFFFSVVIYYSNYFRGQPFIPFLDDLPAMLRYVDRPFIMPIVDKYKDMGTVVLGKVEAGEARRGQTLLVLPNKVSHSDPVFSALKVSNYQLIFRRKSLSISCGRTRRKLLRLVRVRTSKSS